MTGSSAVGRIAKVLTIYAVLAAGAWWAVDPVRQTFLLPPLFSRAARGALVLGAVVALLIAWKYPDIGPPDDVGPK